jgi:hypothetical protein
VRTSEGVGSRSVRLRRWGSGIPCLLACAVTLAGGVLFGQSWDTSKAVIYNPRPLDKAVDFLEAKYGWRMTYEDPLVLYLGDLTDTRPQPSRPGSKPSYAWRWGSIDMRHVLPSLLSLQDDPAVLLQRAIDLYNAGRGVGEFRLLRTGDVFHVIPAKTKNVDGEMVEVASLLDTPVTFPEQEREIGQTMRAITDAVGLATSVTLNRNPLNLGLRHDWEKVVFGASNEPARSALLRLFAMTGNEALSWSLLCAAGERRCTLNIRQIRVEVQAPDGTKKRVSLLVN